MARHRTAKEWAAVREDREIFAMSFSALAKKHGISVATIFKKSVDEGWSDGEDSNAMANKMAREISNNIRFLEPNSTQKSLAERITAAADKKAALILQHQLDWEEHRATYDIKNAENKNLACGKLAAEVLKLRHDGERKAFSITDEDTIQKPEPVKKLSDFYS